jgi:hypothetical protein
MTACIFFVSFVFFVDKMSYCLFNASHHAIISAPPATLLDDIPYFHYY